MGTLGILAVGGVSGYKTSTTRKAIIFLWRDHIAKGQINMQVPLPSNAVETYPLYQKSLKQDFIKGCRYSRNDNNQASTLNSHFILKVVLLNPCISFQHNLY
jgi:hypothetical protein